MTNKPNFSSAAQGAAPEPRSAADIPAEGSAVVLVPTGDGDGTWGVLVADGYVYKGP